MEIEDGADTTRGFLRKQMLMQVIIVLDKDGHLNAFDADSRKIWMGLATEAMTKDIVTIDKYVNVVNLILDRKWEEVIEILGIDTGRSGGNKFDVIEVSEQWIINRIQFE
jgi:hypothetical protein